MPGWKRFELHSPILLRVLVATKQRGGLLLETGEMLGMRRADQGFAGDHVEEPLQLPRQQNQLHNGRDQEQGH